MLVVAIVLSLGALSALRVGGAGWFWIGALMGCLCTLLIVGMIAMILAPILVRGLDTGGQDDRSK